MVDSTRLDSDRLNLKALFKRIVLTDSSNGASNPIDSETQIARPPSYSVI
jgi:hypothetical protein